MIPGFHQSVGNEVSRRLARRAKPLRQNLIELKFGIGLEMLCDAAGHARDGSFSSPGLHFKRLNSTLGRVQQIAENKRVHGVEAEIHREIKAAVACRCMDAMILRERENAESLESGRRQRGT